MKGRKDHTQRLKPTRATGGGIKQSGPHQEQTNAKKGEKPMKAPFAEKEQGNQKIAVTKKKGGRVERKSGGAVKGDAPKARLDKRARGGAAKSPLSGANAPNLGYAHGNLKAGSQGQGKDRT